MNKTCNSCSKFFYELIQKDARGFSWKKVALCPLVAQTTDKGLHYDDYNNFEMKYSR